MSDSIMEQGLQKYLDKQKPFGQCDILEITQLTDGGSNNHLNYKILTSRGAFVARITKPGDMHSYSNLADEFTILKLIESYGVGPRVITIDLENYQLPVLFEEYIEGKAYKDVLKGTEEMFGTLIKLLITISQIPINQSQFPFKFTYTTHKTSFRIWEMRMNEIEKISETGGGASRAYREVIKNTKEYLEKNDRVLRSAPAEFIYNDIHPGNALLLHDGQAKLIDWQKVSLGDPAFMIALFARRFGSPWQMNNHDFILKALQSYMRYKKIPDFETLFYARILERAVSDMIWISWSALKNGASANIKKPEENQYLHEAMTHLEFLKR